MERTILDAALLFIAVSVPLHIVLSLHWRSELSHRLAQFAVDFDEVRQAVNDLAYEPFCDDRPDMIAMLGSDYAPNPLRAEGEAAVAEELGGASKDLTSHQLADVLSGRYGARGEPVYDEEWGS